MTTTVRSTEEKWKLVNKGGGGSNGKGICVQSLVSKNQICAERTFVSRWNDFKDAQEASKFQ